MRSANNDWNQGSAAVETVVSAMGQSRVNSKETAACFTRIRRPDNCANPAAGLNNPAAARNLLFVAGETDGDEFTEDDAARVHAALGDLTPEHREVLVLRFLEGMSYEEIAQVVGDPLGTVKSRIHYAKCALRAALERTNVHE